MMCLKITGMLGTTYRVLDGGSWVLVPAQNGGEEEQASGNLLEPR